MKAEPTTRFSAVPRDRLVRLVLLLADFIYAKGSGLEVNTGDADVDELGNIRVIAEELRHRRAPSAKPARDDVDGS